MIKGNIFSEGFYVVPRKVVDSQDLDVIDKLAYITLLGYSKKGKAIMNLRELSDIMGLDRNTVSRHLKALESAGVITIEPRVKYYKDKQGKRRTQQLPNIYHIHNEI